MKRIHNTDPESGNIIIYVIGAIFLVGVLTALSKGSLTPGAGIDREALILKISQIRSYATELEQGVAYVMRNGHSETEIRFAHPNHSSAYGDLSADTPFTRQVFHALGGNVEWRDNDTDIQSQDLDWVFNARNIALNVVTDETELIAFLPGVTQEFCEYINNSIGNPTTITDNNQVNRTAIFSGNFSATGIRTINTGSGTSYLEACVYTPTETPDYTYYKVLMAR